MASATFSSYLFAQFAAALAKSKREAKRLHLDVEQTNFHVLNVMVNILVATIVALAGANPQRAQSLLVSVQARLARTVKQAADEARGDNIIVPDSLPPDSFLKP